MAYVIQDGIAFHEILSLNDICKKHNFSMIIDESTELSVAQILAVVDRYHNTDEEDVADVLPATVVENESTQTLHNAAKNLFLRRNASLNNKL